MISKGEILTSDGILIVRYTTENGMMKKSFFTPSSSQPRMMTIHDEDLSDQIEFHTWDEDGTQRSKTDQTIIKHWHENGQPHFEMQIKDGKLDGKSVTWYENGEISSEAHFINDVKHGTFKEWDKEGNLISMQVYDMGELVSENEQHQ